MDTVYCHYLLPLPSQLSVVVTSVQNTVNLNGKGTGWCSTHYLEIALSITEES